MLELSISGPIERSDLPGLFARVCGLLERSRAPLLRCDVTGLAADAVAVDALARLALAARRHGCAVRLRGASGPLLELVGLMGLSDALPGEPTSPAAAGARTGGRGSRC